MKVSFRFFRRQRSLPVGTSSWFALVLSVVVLRGFINNVDNINLVDNNGGGVLVVDAATATFIPFSSSMYTHRRRPRRSLADGRSQANNNNNIDRVTKSWMTTKGTTSSAGGKVLMKNNILSEEEEAKKETAEVPLHNLTTNDSEKENSRQATSSSSFVQPTTNKELPYMIKTKIRPGEASSSRAKTTLLNNTTNLIIRYLEDDDLPSAIRMYVKEFGLSNLQRTNWQRSLFRHLKKLITMPSKNLLQEQQEQEVQIPEIIIFVQNYVMAFTLYLGFISRIRYRKWIEEKQQQQKKFPKDQSSNNNGAATQEVDDEDDGSNKMSLLNKLLFQQLHHSDYHVLCMADQDTHEIMGVAEISYQLPYQASPPYILPLAMKELLSKFVYRFNLPVSKAPCITERNSNPDDDDDDVACYSSELIRPYLSNVIINESYRGCGYGSIFMKEVLRHAKENFKSPPSSSGGGGSGGGGLYLTLHVDASGYQEENDETSSSSYSTSALAAQSLYLRLGFEPIKDERGWYPMKNIRFSNIIKNKIDSDGIYFCDGIPMIYMRKLLSSSTDDCNE